MTVNVTTNGSSPPSSYRACSIKRPRRTKDDISCLRGAIYGTLCDDYPMTVQVFYQLVINGKTDKTEKENQGTVIRLLGEMRMNGQIPWATPWGRVRNLSTSPLS